jgi:hypothetical protein
MVVYSQAPSTPSVISGNFAFENVTRHIMWHQGRKTLPSICSQLPAQCVKSDKLDAAGKMYLIGGLDNGCDKKFQVFDGASWKGLSDLPFKSGSGSCGHLNGKVCRAVVNLRSMPNRVDMQCIVTFVGHPQDRPQKS